MRHPERNPVPPSKSCADPQTVPAEPGVRPSSALCPHCWRALNGYRFITDGDLAVTTYHCVEHGDVIPRRALGAHRDPLPLYS